MLSSEFFHQKLFREEKKKNSFGGVWRGKVVGWVEEEEKKSWVLTTFTAKQVAKLEESVCTSWKTNLSGKITKAQMNAADRRQSAPITSYYSDS